MNSTIIINDQTSLFLEIKGLANLDSARSKAPRLPNELIVHIFSFFDMRTLVRCPSICREWKELSSDEILWKGIFEKTNLSQFKLKFFSLDEAWTYRDISSKFIESGRFGAAIAACNKCGELNKSNGAYALRDLCMKACEIKDYEMAYRCQKLAEEYVAYAEKDTEHTACAANETISYIIKSQVTDPNFLENYENLINLSVTLIDKDREFGLQALIAIAKKFADLQLFDKAMELTQLAKTLGDSRVCKRGRNHSDDIHPFNQMSKHMLSLKQYKLAEECADKSVEQCPSSWLYSEIVIKQIREEKFFNEPLYSKVKHGTMPWICASEALVFNLIDMGRIEEAQKIAQERLQLTWFYGMSDFKKKFEEKIK